jgi:hypothetical protein
MFYFLVLENKCTTSPSNIEELVPYIYELF